VGRICGRRPVPRRERDVLLLKGHTRRHAENARRNAADEISPVRHRIIFLDLYGRRPSHTTVATTKNAPATCDAAID
jgi:hypothetical protein